MLTTELKNKIASAIIADSKNYDTKAKHAISLDIHPSILTRIGNGETDGVLADPKWIGIARRLNVELKNTAEIVTAKTDVFTFIYAQLKACQELSLSGQFCDITDIGKTTTAKAYVADNKNAIYIDCGQVKSRQKLIRAIAKEFGVNHTGKYADVYADLVFYLRSIENPLIILDEAGDLEYTADLELKAIWNATENYCGWYKLGAEGLKAKIEKGIALMKVGYTENYRRFGGKFQSVVPAGKDAKEDFLKKQMALVAKANGITNIQSLYAKVGTSLNGVIKEVKKLKAA